MIDIQIVGDPRPPGGIPRQVVIQNQGAAATRYSFFAYQPDSTALTIVERALDLIRERVGEGNRLETCDRAFSAFANVSFSDLFFGDETLVTIFRSPTNCLPGEFALTAGQGLARHLTLTRECWGGGEVTDARVLRTAGTIVHELAHCAGAPGDPANPALPGNPHAERTLPPCGFADVFDPTITG